jgi:ABC-type multidrug transport system fused ATPase/permease subunit
MNLYLNHKHVLKDIFLKIPISGEIIGIMGPNGAGKCMDLPYKYISPLALNVPIKLFSNEDLPAPLGPMMPIISPDIGNIHSSKSAIRFRLPNQC